MAVAAANDRGGGKTEFDNTSRAALIVAIVAVAGLAFVAPAYSYSSTVTTTGTVTSEYITINIMNGEDAATALSIKASDWQISSEAPYSFTLVPKDGTTLYQVKAQSNKDSGAYLYGYFTGAGAGISSLKITVFGQDLTLYRDSPVEQIALANSISDTEPVNTWISNITGYTVSYYGGLQPSSAGNISVTTDGTSEAVSLTDLYSIDGLSICLLTSWEGITSA